MKKVLSLILTLTLLLIIGAVAHADTLTLPADLESIEEEAFAGDTSLDEVVIPEGVVSIGPRAFAGSSVKRVSLPASLNEIADDAFEGTEPTVTTEEGTYAHWWAASHGFSKALAFKLYDQYDYTTQRAAFDDNPEIGLYHANWIRNYQIVNADALAQKYGGEPVWSVEFAGDHGDAVIGCIRSDWAEGGTAVDVGIENEPAFPCTLHYQVTCTWGDESVTGIGTLVYEETELPTGFDVSNEFHGLRIGEEYPLTMQITPAGYIYGESQNLILSTDMDCDKPVREIDGIPVRCVIPHEAGAFSAQIGVRLGNIRLEKKSWLYVEGAKGVTEGELSPRAQELLASKPEAAALTARQLTVNGIPLYEFYRDDGAKKPLVILIHGGGGGRKDSMVNNAIGCAMAGMYAVAIDAPGCGESDIGPIDAVNCWKLIISQIDSLIEYYGEIGQADADNFGMLGGSMGANISYAYVVHGKYRPVAIAAAKGTPDYRTLPPQVAGDVFDHGRAHQPLVMSVEEIEEKYLALLPINHPEAFLDVWIYAGNGLTDTTTGPEGCQALERYLDEAGGTKHNFHYYENCEHGDPMPGYDPVMALHDYLL